jgi:hypothetical protein
MPHLLINFNIAIYVDEPFSSGSNYAAPLTQVLRVNSSRNYLFFDICSSNLID